MESTKKSQLENRAAVCVSAAHASLIHAAELQIDPNKASHQTPWFFKSNLMHSLFVLTKKLWPAQLAFLLDQIKHNKVDRCLRTIKLSAKRFPFTWCAGQGVVSHIHLFLPYSISEWTWAPHILFTSLLMLFGRDFCFLFNSRVSAPPRDSLGSFSSLLVSPFQEQKRASKKRTKRHSCGLYYNAETEKSVGAAQRRALSPTQANHECGLNWSLCHLCVLPRLCTCYTLAVTLCHSSTHYICQHAWPKSIDLKRPPQDINCKGPIGC